MKIQRIVETVWAGEFRREERDEIVYYLVEVELHASPNGDVGFCALVVGGTSYRLDRDGSQYSTPLSRDWDFYGRVCNLPGSVAEALRPYKENYTLVREF